jgi:hypothetical protein
MVNSKPARACPAFTWFDCLLNYLLNFTTLFLPEVVGFCFAVHQTHRNCLP